MNNIGIIEYLQKESEELTNIIVNADRRLVGAPDGYVRIARHRKGYQFYLRTDPEDKSGTYMPISEQTKAVKLLQKAYDLKVKAAAEKQRSLINHFLEGYDPDIFKKMYASLSEPRRLNIQPVDISDEEYVKNWLAYEYEYKEFSEDVPEHFTSKGERVRSKSEVMIAEALRKNNIPYRYECPLKLGSIVVHPDFTILRIADRKTLYWEHLGMMDDSEYCNRAIQKIRKYEKYGIYTGSNLILSVETTTQPINMSIINHLIQRHC